MARTMNESAKAVFRAVITCTVKRRDGSEIERRTVAGPFDRTNEASAAITRARRVGLRSLGSSAHRARLLGERPSDLVRYDVTGRVQRAALVWQDIE